MTEREKAIEGMQKIAERLLQKHFEETRENGIETREIYGVFYDEGYRKVDKDGVFHIDISDEFVKECKAEIDKAYRNGFDDGRKDFLNDARAQVQNEIYLNASEAKKERSKEIFARVFNKDECGDLGEFCGKGWIFSVEEAKAIAAEFGVEVEE